METTYKLFPILQEGSYGIPAEQWPSQIVIGERIPALRTLARGSGRSVRLAYLDLPRINVDDKSAAFRGDGALVYSTWLSVLEAHLRAIEPTLRRDGVVVLHVGDLEAPFARLLADEFFRGQYIGSVVWQRSYAPRNMPNMKEFTATHDCLVMYAKDRAALPAVGLRSEAKGFSNPDEDPRGPWKAEHKGAKARRAKSDFDTFVPPYRWRLAEGKLPDGIWRVSPLTGVIWGEEVKEVGEFQLTVEARDCAGSIVIRQLTLHVRAQGEASQAPDVPWLFRQHEPSGKLRITTKTLPDGVCGKEYMTILLADGGEAFRAAPKRPQSGRYWEFADDTLLLAYQHDAVYLGRTEPTAIPHPKAYLERKSGSFIENQQTWWPGRKRASGKKESDAFAGYTEDATKHLKALKELGLLRSEPSTAKPEALLARLIDIFSVEGDVVLEVFGGSADLAAVALKRNRRFVYLAGDTERSLLLLHECALPRLQAVVDGKDQALESALEEIGLRADSYIQYAGGGGFRLGKLGPWLLSREVGSDLPRLNTNDYSDRSLLFRGILGLEGFLPIEPVSLRGVSPDGMTMATVLPPEIHLTTELAADLATEILATELNGVIYYFRSSTDFSPTIFPARVAFRRIPYDMGI